MNRVALLLVLALSLPLTARADEASHRAKAQQMMALLHTDKNVQQVVDNIGREVAEAADKAVGADPTPEKKAKLNDFEQQAHQLIDAQLGWKSLQAGFTDIYAKAFTEEQLDSIIAFYKSPAGIALLDSMPDVNTEIGKLGQSRVAAVQPQLQQLYSTFKQSLAAAPPTLGPTSPTMPPAAPAAAPATTPK
jgi:hypothetical protein